MNQKLRNYPFWILCSLFCLGVFISNLTNLFLPVKIISICFIAPFLGYSYRKKSNTTFSIVTGILFIILGITRHQVANPKHQTNHLVNVVQPEDHKKVLISIKEVFKASNKSRNYKAQIHSYGNKKLSGYALLSVQKNDTIPKLKVSDTFITYCKLKTLNETGNPYVFEYVNYLKNIGITHKIQLTHQQLYPIEPFTNSWNIFFNGIRNRIETNLKKQSLTPDVLQITEALVLGNKSLLNKELKINFANAGVIHILAISGLHIGVLYFLLNGLFTIVFPYSKNNVYVTIAIVLLLWLFTWFSGSSPSALRATSMFTCFQITKSTLRHQHPINALFLSSFILVLINPIILFSVGFQLSVMAVGSIIIGVPKLLTLWYPQNWFVNKIWSIICMSFCAQIGILPLSIYYFHQFSSLFLLANVPIMLVIVFVLSGALLIVTLSYWDQTPNLFINMYNESVLYLIQYINWIAQLDIFIIKKIYITPVSLIFLYILFAYIIYLYKKTRKAHNWISPILAVTFLICFWEYNQLFLKDELWVLNNYNNTIITELTSETIKIHSKNKITTNDFNYTIQPIVGKLHYSKVNTLVLQNSYNYRGKKINIITSKNHIPNSKTNGIFILDLSPKINMERLLQNHQPKLIIAGAHNYSNLVEKWKATCSKEHVTFYNINKSGAFNLTDVSTYQ